jgi:hypothetical protein
VALVARALLFGKRKTFGVIRAERKRARMMKRIE